MGVQKKGAKSEQKRLRKEFELGGCRPKEGKQRDIPVRHCLEHALTYASAWWRIMCLLPFYLVVSLPLVMSVLRYVFFARCLLCVRYLHLSCVFTCHVFGSCLLSSHIQLIVVYCLFFPIVRHVCRSPFFACWEFC